MDSRACARSRIGIASVAFIAALSSCAAKKAGPSFDSVRAPGLLGKLGAVDRVETAADNAREVEGRLMSVPLVALAERPSSDGTSGPAFDLAVFADGSILYAGKRCVKETGFAVSYLTPAQLDAVKTLAARSHQLPASVSDDEVCVEEEIVRKVVSSDRDRVSTRTNRCASPAAAGSPFAAFADELVRLTDAKIWIGQPTEWTSCNHTAGAFVQER